MWPTYCTKGDLTGRQFSSSVTQSYMSSFTTGLDKRIPSRITIRLPQFYHRLTCLMQNKKTTVTIPRIKVLRNELEKKKMFFFFLNEYWNRSHLRHSTRNLETMNTVGLEKNIMYCNSGIDESAFMAAESIINPSSRSIFLISRRETQSFCTRKKRWSSITFSQIAWNKIHLMTMRKSH